MIPRMLRAPGVQGISTKRALDNIKTVIETLEALAPNIPASLEDRINAALDDIKTMLECIE